MKLREDKSYSRIGCGISAVPKLSLSLSLSLVSPAQVLKKLGLRLSLRKKSGQIRPSLNIKRPRRSLLATGAVLGLALLVGTGVTLLNQNRSAQAADTGTATLSAVNLTQVGTGLAGEDSSHVLTNDLVTYQAIYQITTPGSITMTVTFPGNNVIDPLSISSQAGCDSGSALDLTPDSKTYNVATCIINASAPGSVSWSFGAKLWGANGASVQPTLAISGVDQSLKPAALTLLAPSSNYNLYIALTADPFSLNGYIRSAYFRWGLYAPFTATGGVTGLEPLQDGEYSFKIDTSQLPNGWVVLGCSTYGYGSLPGSTTHNPGGSTNSVVYAGGNPTCVKSSDGSYLTITRSGAATGVAYYPRFALEPAATMDPLQWGAFYSAGTIMIGVPASMLTNTTQQFQLTASDFTATNLSGVANSGSIANQSSWNLPMDNQAKGSGMQFVDNLGDGTGTYAHTHRVRAGQTFDLQVGAQTNNVPLATNNNADNFYSCNTFDPSGVAFDGSPIWQDAYVPTNPSERIIEYGVVGTDMTTVPEPGVGGINCGEAGDGAANFFVSLADAQAYAAINGLQVNAFRIWTKTLRTGRDVRAVILPMKITPNSVTNTLLPTGTIVKFLNRNKTDQWVGTADYHYQNLVIIGGQTMATLSASPSAITVGEIAKLTLTSRVSGVDTNVAATITLPIGLNYLLGSGAIQGVPLEPTVTSNSDGTKTLVFSLGTLGTDPVANDAEQPPLTFNVTTNADVIMSQTMNVSSVLTSDGDTNMPLSYRTTDTSFSVVVPQASFNYTLSQSTSIVQPGDSLTYAFTDFNSSTASVNNVNQIVVLPYNNDGRGTTNLSSYQVAEFVTTTSPSSNLTLYYTTDTAIRSDSGASVSWTLYSGGALSSSAVAVRWSTSLLAIDTIESVRLRLDDIVASNNAIIALDITRVSTSEFGTGTSLSPVTAVYREGSISGKVYIDSDSSNSLSGGEVGMAGVTLNLHAGDTTGTVLATTTSDADGTYQFGGLKSGVYSVTAEAVTGYLINSDNAAQSQTLQAGQDLTGANLGFIAEMVSLGISKTGINISATPSGGVATDNLTATVTSNIPRGYNLTIHSSQPNLKCTIASTDYFINAVSGTSPSLLNTWGYGVSVAQPTSWTGLTTTPALLKSTNTATSTQGEPTDVWFGTKVDFSLPACKYTGTVTITVMGN